MFALSLPSFFSEKNVLPRTEASLTGYLVAAGFFQGITTPLFYELAAEIIYPIKEGMSAGIIVCILNATSLVVIAMNSFFTPKVMNAVMAFTIIGVLVAVFFVKEEYKRDA